METTTSAQPKKDLSKLGLFLIIAPPVGLFITMIVYPIASFILNRTASATDGALIALKISSLIFGLLGLIFLLGTIIGVPLGIYFFVRKK